MLPHLPWPEPAELGGASSHEDESLDAMLDRSVDEGIGVFLHVRHTRRYYVRRCDFLAAGELVLKGRVVRARIQPVKLHRRRTVGCGGSGLGASARCHEVRNAGFGEELADPDRGLGAKAAGKENSFGFHGGWLRLKIK